MVEYFWESSGVSSGGFTSFGVRVARVFVTGLLFSRNFADYFFDAGFDFGLVFTVEVAETGFLEHNLALWNAHVVQVELVGLVFDVGQN